MTIKTKINIEKRAIRSFLLYFCLCFLFLQILYGNVASGGAVAKITGKEGLTFSGLAKVRYYVIMLLCYYAINIMLLC